MSRGGGTRRGTEGRGCLNFTWIHGDGMWGRAVKESLAHDASAKSTYVLS